MIERGTNGRFVCECDECGKRVALHATNPTGATSQLRKKGWRRQEFVTGLWVYMWACDDCRRQNNLHAA